MSRMGGVKNIVKPSQKFCMLYVYRVGKNPEHFFVEGIFGYIVVVIKPCLSCPADMKGGKNIMGAPFHYFLELIPVLNLFKIKLLHRRSCNDKAVKLFIFYIAESIVKLFQMLARGVSAFIGLCLKKNRFYLQRRVSQQPHKLCLCRDLCRHKVENSYPQRPYILVKCPVFSHCKDIFAVKNFTCRKVVRYFYRHIILF